jgi:hypothetical protein
MRHFITDGPVYYTIQVFTLPDFNIGECSFVMEFDLTFIRTFTKLLQFDRNGKFIWQIGSQS